MTSSIEKTSIYDDGKFQVVAVHGVDSVSLVFCFGGHALQVYQPNIPALAKALMDWHGPPSGETDAEMRERLAKRYVDPVEKALDRYKKPKKDMGYRDPRGDAG